MPKSVGPILFWPASTEWQVLHCAVLKNSRFPFSASPSAADAAAACDVPEARIVTARLSSRNVIPVSFLSDLISHAGA